MRRAQLTAITSCSTCPCGQAAAVRWGGRCPLIDRKRQRDETLALEGQPIETVWFVKRGTVILSRTGPDGIERPRLVRGPGSLSGSWCWFVPRTPIRRVPPSRRSSAESVDNRSTHGSVHGARRRVWRSNRRWSRPPTIDRGLRAPTAPRSSGSRAGSSTAPPRVAACRGARDDGAGPRNRCADRRTSEPRGDLIAVMMRAARAA